MVGLVLAQSGYLWHYAATLRSLVWTQLLEIFKDYFYPKKAKLAWMRKMETWNRMSKNSRLRMDPFLKWSTLILCLIHLTTFNQSECFNLE